MGGLHFSVEEGTPWGSTCSDGLVFKQIHGVGGNLGWGGIKCLKRRCNGKKCGEAKVLKRGGMLRKRVGELRAMRIGKLLQTV